MIPIIMNKLEGQGFFKKYPRAPAPLQVISSFKLRIVGLLEASMQDCL